MLFKKQAISFCFTRNIIPTSLVLIGAVAFYNWLVAPHRNYLQAAERYELVKTDLEKKNHIINDTLKIKREKVEKLQEKLEQTYTLLFAPIEAREFLSSIQTVVDSTDCTVDSLQFLTADSVSKGERSEKNSYIITQRAKLSVIGRYGNITLLMNKLQNRPEQVRIDDVTIKSIRNNSGQLKCSMDITIHVMLNKETYAND